MEQAGRVASPLRRVIQRCQLPGGQGRIRAQDSRASSGRIEGCVTAVQTMTTATSRSVEGAARERERPVHRGEGWESGREVKKFETSLL